MSGMRVRSSARYPAGPAGPTRVIDTIPAAWRLALAPAIDSPSFRRLVDFVAAERARTDTTIYPPESDVFTALRLTPLASVRAVILGQDPYHGEGQAQGLAFSVPSTQRIAAVIAQHPR